MVMQSSGGVIDADGGARPPGADRRVRPRGRRHRRAPSSARRAGYDNIITFDMGGTTAKASLIEDGQPARTPRSTRSAAACRSRSALAGRRRLRAQAAGDRHLRGRRRRRQHRLARRGGRAQGRPATAPAPMPGPACYGARRHGSRRSPTPTSCSATSTRTRSPAARCRSTRRSRAAAVGERSPGRSGRDLRRDRLRHPPASPTPT